MSGDSETILRVVHDEALARDWELVLLAQGLTPRLRCTLDGIVITVPRHEAERALAGLLAYENENSATVQAPKPAPRPVDWWAGAVAAVALLGFFAVTGGTNKAVSALERGSANAARILDGELWRTVTALTLHADVAHALSNAVALAIFFGVLSSQLGAGVAGALVLVAGTGAYLANAYFQGPPHNAVGASTAVFAAVGILGSLAMVRRRRESGEQRRAWIGLAAALALLGMLGSGGARVDVLAHVLGFLIGAVMGVIIAPVLPRVSGAAIQWLCGVATIALILYCWILT